MSDRLEIEGTTVFQGFNIDYQMSVVEEGQIPILLLGGAFQTTRSWRPFRKHFKDKNSILTINVPGTFKADLLPRSYDFRWVADSVKHVLDHLQIEKINVYALSYSAPLGVCLAAKYPETVKRLMLSGSTTQFPKLHVEQIDLSIKILQSGETDLFTRLASCVGLINLDPKIKIYRREQVFRILWNQLRKINLADTERYIENTYRYLDIASYLEAMKPKCLTLGIAGEYDLLTPPEDGFALISSFDRYIFTKIKNADHLCFMERSDVVLDLVESFFNESNPKFSEACTTPRYSHAPSALEPS